MPAPDRVDPIDGGPVRDEPVDDLEALVVRGHDERADPGVRRRAVEPAGHVARGGGDLDALDARAGGDEDVDDVGHAEHGRVEQGVPAGYAAGVGRRRGLDVRARRRSGRAQRRRRRSSPP